VSSAGATAENSKTTSASTTSKDAPVSAVTATPPTPQSPKPSARTPPHPKAPAQAEPAAATPANNPQANLGQPDQVPQRNGRWEGGEPVVGGLAGGHSASSQHSGRPSSGLRGRLRLVGRTRRARKRERILALGLAAFLREPWCQTPTRPGRRDQGLGGDGLVRVGGGRPAPE
jgi:hypothetical protein